MIRRALLLGCALAACGAARAQPIAIVNAHLFTAGPAGEIARGVVVFDHGRILAVGANAPVPAGARVIDAAGGVVTPGLFATGSELGAVEVSAVGNDLTADAPEIGASFDPSVDLDPNSTLIPVARLGGLTRAVLTPHPARERGGDVDETADFTAGVLSEGGVSHGLFAGQAAVVDLGGDADMVTRAGVGLVVPFGETGAAGGGGSRGAQIAALRAAFADARDYAANRAAYERGAMRALSLSKADLEALVPVVQGRLPMIAQVHRAADIRAVIALARQEKVRLILEGAEEGWLVADDIARSGAPVLLNPLEDRPDSFEQLAATMDNAARLDAAGVMIAIESSEAGAHRARETRYDAGDAVAHGLPWNAALAAVTINPARIFGVADRVGSLEVGKEADVVVWTGDPFEPLSQVTAVFVKGVSRPLQSRQTELRDRYKTLGRPLPPAYSH